MGGKKPEQNQKHDSPEGCYFSIPFLLNREMTLHLKKMVDILFFLRISTLLTCKGDDYLFFFFFSFGLKFYYDF